MSWATPQLLPGPEVMVSDGVPERKAGTMLPKWAKLSLELVKKKVGFFLMDCQISYVVLKKNPLEMAW